MVSGRLRLRLWGRAWTDEPKAMRKFAKISQSRRRSLQEPSPGLKRVLLLSHLRHYTTVADVAAQTADTSLLQAGFFSVITNLRVDLRFKLFSEADTASLFAEAGCWWGPGWDTGWVSHKLPRTLSSVVLGQGTLHCHCHDVNQRSLLLNHVGHISNKGR